MRQFCRNGQLGGSASSMKVRFGFSETSVNTLIVNACLGMLLSAAMVALNAYGYWSYQKLSAANDELIRSDALLNTPVSGSAHHQRLHALAVEATEYAVRVRGSSLRRELSSFKSTGIVSACQFILFALLAGGLLQRRANGGASSG